MKRFIDVFLSPLEMIDGVRAKPDFGTPFTAMLVLYIAAGVLQVLLVDHGYYIAGFMRFQRELISQDQAEITQQALENRRSTMAVINQATLLWSAHGADFPDFLDALGDVAAYDPSAHAMLLGRLFH